ncbi:MAG: sigma-54 dependent transcriptional regulator [Gallionella sp.]
MSKRPALSVFSDSPRATADTRNTFEDERNAPESEQLDIVGLSPAIHLLRQQITSYAALPFPVLIQGESGCGKELIALALQKLSRANRANFKTLNCASVPITLLETTLFGHSKGAYTGAYRTQAGFFEEAADGTLFLDEIGELPLDLQARLLRVLENGEYQRVGETHTRHSHARILAATNRNLRNEVALGKFRADLYHRLNVFAITAPPLRELGADKLLLLRHFREHYARQFQCLPFEFSADAMVAWEHYYFPGNTRELRNIVLRLTAKYPGQTIQRKRLLTEFDSPQLNEANEQSASVQQRIQDGHFDLDRELRAQENLYIDAALKLAAHNITDAARLLGINRTTLYSRMDAQERSRVNG